MKPICLGLLLLFSFCSFSMAQEYEFEEESDLFTELLDAVGFDDELFVGTEKMRVEFRKKFAGQMGTCDETTCLSADYFSAISGFYLYQGERGKTQQEVLDFYRQFYQEELEYLESQGINLRAKVKTRQRKAKEALWFQLWQSSSTGLAMGNFDLSMLGCALALLDYGIGLDEKTGMKTSLGADFKGAMAERLLGIADDGIADSGPIRPNPESLKALFGKPDLLNFTYKGKPYHMIIKAEELYDAYYLLVELDEIGYDVTKGDCAKCKGMNSLMVYAFSEVGGYGRKGERYPQEVFDHLKKYKSSLDMQDNKGNTALHYAAANVADWYVYALIDLGVDLNKENKKGQTALSILQGIQKKEKTPKTKTTALGANDRKREKVQDLIKALKSAGAQID